MVCGGVWCGGVWRRGVCENHILSVALAGGWAVNSPGEPDDKVAM